MFKFEPILLSTMFAAFIGVIIGVMNNPTPSAQQLYTASVAHYQLEVGDKWTSEGQEAIFKAYWSACSGR